MNNYCQFMNNILKILLVALIGFGATSCKEEVGPTLIVSAVDTLGAPLTNITVLSHPCFFNQDNCDTARLDENFIKEAQSNAQGQVIFEFPYSAVLDIVVVEPVLDSASGDTLDIRFGQNVVALESKELKKDEKNEYETTVVVDKFLR